MLMRFPAIVTSDTANASSPLRIHRPVAPTLSRPPFSGRVLGIDPSLRGTGLALIEFVAATTRPLSGNGKSLLSAEEARRELEEMLVQFEVVYPDEDVVRLAIRGAATYKLPWFDAHMWAYAERFGLDTLWSEDFANGRLYGRVRARDPFVES